MRVDMFHLLFPTTNFPTTRQGRKELFYPYGKTFAELSGNRISGG